MSIVDFEIINRDINPKIELKDIVVEGDSNSKKFYFEINRYFDGVDLSQCNIEIGYKNADGKTDYSQGYLYEFDTSGNKFTFYWIVPSSVTVQSGIVSIFIEFSLKDNSNKKIYVWKTKMITFPIEKSFQILGDATPLDYEDQKRYYESFSGYPIVNISDTDEPIYIVGRKILMPNLEDVAVVGDNRSQIISFVMQRYYDNVDRSKKVIAICFKNAEGKGDRIPPVNVVVSDDTITFGWLLDSKVTVKSGYIDFKFEVLGYDEFGEFYAWSTLSSQIYVSEGLDVDPFIEKPEPSWLQEWLIQEAQIITNEEERKQAEIERNNKFNLLISTINTVNNTANTAIQNANQALQNANVAYEMASNLVAEKIGINDNSISKSETYSSEKIEDKIKIKAQFDDVDVQSGSFIHSSKSEEAEIFYKIEGATYQKQTIQSKNIFNMYGDYIQNSDIVSVSRVDKTITIVSNNTIAYSNIRFKLPKHLYANKTVTLSYESFTSTVPDIGSRVQLMYIVNGIAQYRDFSVNGTTLTIPENITDIYIRIMCNNVPTAPNIQSTVTVTGIQVEYGSVKTQYETFTPDSPSVDYPSVIESLQNFNIIATGKNILPRFSNNFINGVTLNVLEDGTIILNGTASSAAYFTVPINLVLNGTYTFCANNNFVHNSIAIKIKSNDTVIFDLNLGSGIGHKVTKTVNNIMLKEITLSVSSGSICNNLQLKPQLEYGNVASNYVSPKYNKITIPYELNKLPNGVADTLEYIGNGKAKYTERLIKTTINGTGLTIYVDDVGTNTVVFRFTPPIKANPTLNYNDRPYTIICDRFKARADTYTGDNEGIMINQEGLIFVRVKRSRLTEISSNGCKMFLQNNPITVVYERLDPVETIIDLPSLLSYSDSTNVYTNSQLQPTITACFRSKLSYIVDIFSNEIEKLKNAILALGGNV